MGDQLQPARYGCATCGGRATTSHPRSLHPANRSRPARTAIPWWSSLIRQMRAQSLESVAHGGQSAVPKPWHLRGNLSASGMRLTRQEPRCRRVLSQPASSLVLMVLRPRKRMLYACYRLHPGPTSPQRHETVGHTHRPSPEPPPPPTPIIRGRPPSSRHTSSIAQTPYIPLSPPLWPCCCRLSLSCSHSDLITLSTPSSSMFMFM